MSTAAAVSERPVVVPSTVFQLRQLKAGDRLRYYRGNFASDIALNEGEHNARYAGALRTVRDEAETLARSGYVQLQEISQPYVDAKGRERLSGLIEYYAVGWVGHDSGPRRGFQAAHYAGPRDDRSAAVWSCVSVPEFLDVALFGQADRRRAAGRGA